MHHKIKYWLIPQGWMDLKRTIHEHYRKAVNKRDDYDTDIKNSNLQRFRDLHRGKRCFILASGPSINNVNLLPLADEYCISVSQFFLHPHFDLIRPKYHCFAPQHYPFNDETNRTIFDNYVSNVFYPLECFIGTTRFDHSYYNFLKKNSEYNIKANFINYEYAKDIDESNFRNKDIWDIQIHPFSIRTVIYEAIQLAYFMGFHEIYLLGVDHDYLKDVNRTTNHHFYTDDKSYSDQEHLSMISKEQWFFIYYSRWKQYRLMNTFLREKGTKIYNATPDSMLDVFPKADFNVLFEK